MGVRWAAVSACAHACPFPCWLMYTRILDGACAHACPSPPCWPVHTGACPLVSLRTHVSWRQRIRRPQPWDGTPALGPLLPVPGSCQPASQPGGARQRPGLCPGGCGSVCKTRLTPTGQAWPFGEGPRAHSRDTGALVGPGPCSQPRGASGSPFSKLGKALSGSGEEPADLKPGHWHVRYTAGAGAQ